MARKGKAKAKGNAAVRLTPVQQHAYDGIAHVRAQLPNMPEFLQGAAPEGIVAATEGFSGSDLMGVFHDAKSLLAFDEANEALHPDPAEYFRRAVSDVQGRRNAYLAAERNGRDHPQAEVED